MSGDYYDPIFAKHLGSFLNWVNIFFLSLFSPCPRVNLLMFTQTAGTFTCCTSICPFTRASMYTDTMYTDIYIRTLIKQTL